MLNHANNVFLYYLTFATLNFLSGMFCLSVYWFPHGFTPLKVYQIIFFLCLVQVSTCPVIHYPLYYTIILLLCNRTLCVWPLETWLCPSSDPLISSMTPETQDIAETPETVMCTIQVIQTLWVSDLHFTSLMFSVLEYLFSTK